MLLTRFRLDFRICDLLHELKNNFIELELHQTLLVP